MKERIKELAKEAGMIYGQGNLDDFDMLTYMPKEVRFAELIIKECAKHAVDFNNYIQSLPDKVMRSNLNRVGDYLSDRTGDVE